MKKIILATALIASSSLLSAAQVGDISMGIEFGTLKSDATAKATIEGIGTFSDNSAGVSTTYEALTVGKYFDFGRIGVGLGYGNKKDDVSTTYIGVNYDYMFYNKSTFTPFIGGILSYSSSKYDDDYVSITETGFSYGFEAGTTFEISKHFDLEIGARYLWSNVEGDTTETILGRDVKIKIDTDSIQQLYFGVGYNF